MLRTLRVPNVRHAYAQGLAIIAHHGIREESRNGPVLVLDGPLVTTYTRPTQRVLLDPQRDANPFFHLLESMWMLAGRRDVESLMCYNAGMQKYSDDGVSFHGAYGHRWADHFGFDQLNEAISLLRSNLADRRVVIGMWDPRTDLGHDGADFPCNTQVYLRVREEIVSRGTVSLGHLAPPGTLVPAQMVRPVLDMSVLCRSNDMKWGGYGANAVHFSVLQEFIAAMVGVGVGEMHQFSNNAHLYEATMPAQPPADPDGDYGNTTPLFWGMENSSIEEVMAELDALWDGDYEEIVNIPASTVMLVMAMRQAWMVWKSKGPWAEYCAAVAAIPHEDWQDACAEWGDRRREKFVG